MYIEIFMEKMADELTSKHHVFIIFFIKVATFPPLPNSTLKNFQVFLDLFLEKN
jgi:hypothetical protein